MFSNVIQNVSTETLWGIIVVMGVILVFLLWEHFYIRAQLQFKQERYWWVLGASDMYIFEYDILADELRLSDHFAALLGVPSHVFQFTKVVRNANEAKLERGLGVVDCVLQHDDYKSLDTVSLKRADGSIGMFRVRCNSFRDSQGKIAFKTGILVDVTREVREEETLRAKAEIDGLTGIYNSSTIKYLIEKSLDAGMNGKSGAFVMFDIDHFKTINDTYGHAEGDFAICTLAHGVKAICGKEAACARFGGDEFDSIVFADDVTELTEEILGQRLQEYIDRTEGVDRKPYQITASIGVVIQERSRDLNIEQMIGEADTLMYCNKKKNR